MKKNQDLIHIGTSGWSYDHWADGVFYPKHITSKDWLVYYSQFFKTVEVNACFYHQLTKSTFQKWYQITPKDFIFSLKLSRFITHVKKLNQVSESWHKFIYPAKSLKEKLGPILVQLPPFLKVNTQKLERLLKLISSHYQVALEARHPSWFCQAVFQLLKKYRAALVFAHSRNWTGPQVITANFVYLRMHGPEYQYGSDYNQRSLKSLVLKIKNWKKQKLSVYLYFNNDEQGLAVKNARQLINLVKT